MSFRFRLRTALLLIAGLAPVCWWAQHSYSWIQERHGFVSRHASWRFQYGATPPHGLWILGEKGVRSASAGNPTVLNDRMAFARLFPEAELYGGGL